MIRVAIVVAALCVGATARADLNRAKQLYEQGRTQYNLNEYEKALDLFKRAYQERADPAFLFNIAQCERALSRFDGAEKSYRAYLRESPDLPEQRVAEVRELIAAMTAAAQQQRANSSPPRTERQHAVAPQQPAPPLPAPVAFIDTGRPMRLAGSVTAAAGVALLALGGVFAGLSYKAGQDAYHSPSGVYDHNADARQTTFRDADIACFVVGGAAVIAGATVWLIGRKRRETPTARTAGVHLTPNGVAF